MSDWVQTTAEQERRIRYRDAWSAIYKERVRLAMSSVVVEARLEDPSAIESIDLDQPEDPARTHTLVVTLSDGRRLFRSIDPRMPETH